MTEQSIKDRGLAYVARNLGRLGLFTPNGKPISDMLIKKPEPGLDLFVNTGVGCEPGKMRGVSLRGQLAGEEICAHYTWSEIRKAFDKAQAARYIAEMNSGGRA